MAVIVTSDDPDKLRSQLQHLVKFGSIRTWDLDSDGDFTHASTQWGNKAWFRLKTHKNKLQFGIISSKRHPMTKELYGVYHGRFAAMLLTHFDTEIRTLVLTPNPEPEIDYL